MATEYCRHIRPNGARCGSFALNGELRCFWHKGLQQRHRTFATITSDTVTDPTLPGNHTLATKPHPDEPVELDFPELEDRASIQLALSMLLGALARNRIDARRAGPLLYGLQVASSNVRDFPAPSHIVRSASIDEHGQPLAPDEDPEEITDFELFQEDYEAELQKEDDDEYYESKYTEE